jgi:hypothetical protein
MLYELGKLSLKHQEKFSHNSRSEKIKLEKQLTNFDSDCRRIDQSWFPNDISAMITLWNP